MLQYKQWTSWLKVFILMSIFTLFQIPISQYAAGGMMEVNNRPILPSENVQYHSNDMNYSKIQQGNKTEIDNNAEEDNKLEAENNFNKENYLEQDNHAKKDNQYDGLKKAAKTVYLTIDDGPGEVSEKFLDILEDYKIKATFFVLEPQVRHYSEVVCRMASEGHELGGHGVTHNVKKFYASPESAVTEFNLTRDALREVTSQECLLVRTPYGSSPYLSEEQEKVIKEEGYKMWDWNVDSRDWYYRDYKYVQSTIEQVERLSDRGIEPVILIHELETTAKNLPELIENLVSNDYEFKTLDLNAKPVRLR